MPRTLTYETDVAAAKNTGTRIRRILQINYAKTTLGEFETKWYSTSQFSFDPGTGSVTVEARVKSWGSMVTQADPQKAGGNSQQTIELVDTDHQLKARFDAFPGIQTAHVKIWLWTDRTASPAPDWSAADWGDAICLFGGLISNPVTWNESTGTYRCTLKGFENLFDRNLGVTLSRDRFPDVQCTDAEGKQMPLVYGAPCIRVPCLPINRPGYATLSRTLHIHDSSLFTHLTASQGKFSLGTITLILGNQGSWEAITGHYVGADSNEFVIESRGAIEASGISPGVGASDGVIYFLLTRTDLVNPDNTRIGQPIWTKHASDTDWHEWNVGVWFQVGSNQAAIRQPSDYTFNSGDHWKIGRIPGVIPIFPAGSTVSEKAPWVFACNAAPSKSVVRVEAKTTVQDAVRGGTRTVYMSYSNDPSVYTVHLNDQSYNTQFGRASDAPGITTIQIAQPPSYFNFDDQNLYVTLEGCTIGGTSGDLIFDGTNSSYFAASNPVDIIRHMLCSSVVGQIDQGAFIDTDAFAEAWDHCESIPLQMAFAITDVKKLHQAISEIAFQAMLLYFWDGGRAVLKPIKVMPDASDSVITITPSLYRRASMQTDQFDIRETTTELASTFRLSQSSDQVTLTRSVPDAIMRYGLRQDTIELWAYQRPTLVALVTEFWLAYRLNRQRSVKFDMFLHGLKLRPGDTIILSVADGNGVSIWDNVPARISAISHESGDARRQTMERLTVTAEITLWSWSVTAITPPLRDCTMPIGTALGPVSDSLPLGVFGGGGDPDSGMPDPIGIRSIISSFIAQAATGGGSVALHFGVTTSALTSSPTDPWTGAGTVTCDEFVPDPADTSTPRHFTTGTTGVSVVVRDNLTIQSGSFVIWGTISLPDGTSENELIWVQPPGAQYHLGLTTSSITTAATDPWTDAKTITCTEYVDDPTDSSTPRKYISHATGITVVVRSKIKIPSGRFVMWIDVTLSDGTVEHLLVWADCK